MSHRQLRFGVFMLARNPDGTFLFVRHVDREEVKGRWSLPGGGLEQAELVDRGACREVLEETGRIVRPGRLVGFFSERKAAGVLVLFEGKVVAKRPAGLYDTDEIQEVRSLVLHEALELDLYPAQRGLIERYLRWNRGKQVFDFMIPPLQKT